MATSQAVSAASSAAATAAAKPVAAKPAENALNKLSGDFNSFLTLLTTQLQNQDPLSPMDSNEFTNQLVQFSSVEQEIQSNKNLESLISLMSGNSSSAALSYIGREVTTTNGETNLINGKASWSYEVDPSAISSSITVKDAKGKAVFIADGKTGPGQQAFEWDGKNKAGANLPEGVYTLSVAAAGNDNKPLSTKVYSTGIVTGVETIGKNPTLIVGGVKLDLKDVVSVTQPKQEAAMTDSTTTASTGTN